MYDLVFNLANEVKYFPSFEDGAFCFLSGLGPETRVLAPFADPYQWSYHTLLDCCKHHFEYDMDDCMKSGGYAFPSGMSMNSAGHAFPGGIIDVCPPERTGEL